MLRSEIRAACAQSFAPWQQATIEFTRRDHSIIACSRHVYMGVVLHAHSVRGEPRIQRNASGEIATLAYLGRVKWIALLSFKTTFQEKKLKEMLNV